MTILIYDRAIANKIVLKHIIASVTFKDVVAFSNPKDALAYFSDNSISLLVISLTHPTDEQKAGTDTLRNAARQAKVPIIVLSHDPCKEAKRQGSDHHLQMPLNLNELKALVWSLVGLPVDRRKLNTLIGVHAASPSGA